MFLCVKIHCRAVDIIRDDRSQNAHIVFVLKLFKCLTVNVNVRCVTENRFIFYMINEYRNKRTYIL